MKETLTRRIRVYGIVQGVGFRPTVAVTQRLVISMGASVTKVLM